MDNDLGFGYGHRRKRTHSHIDLDGPLSPWDSYSSRLSASREPSFPSESHPQVSGLHLPRIGAMPPHQPRRYPGDGMDYRRPVSLQRNEEQAAIIDLTADDAGPSASSAPNSRRTTARVQRPPRFAREIIDLVDEDTNRSVTPSESPEIQFISSRRLATPRLDPHANHGGSNDQDDVEFVGENPLPADRRRGGDLQEMMAGVINDLGGAHHHYHHLQARIQRVMNEAHAPLAPPRAMGAHPRRAGNIHMGFIPPDMDFNIVGFDIGYGAAAPPSPPPTYDKPVAAPEGFTRNPAEDDAIICPNCEDELCLGDSDLKKQVWIVKGCGHVYCGECTANRSVKKSAKGKERAATSRTQPFKVCVVDGCGRKTFPPKAMIQVFL